MNILSVWAFNIFGSAVLMLMGAMEFVGIMPIIHDSLMFGSGIIIVGMILMTVSVSGWIAAEMEMAERFLDNFQDEMYMAVHKNGDTYGSGEGRRDQ